MENININDLKICNEPMAEYFNWYDGAFRVPSKSGEASYCLEGVRRAIMEMLHGKKNNLEIIIREVIKNNDHKLHGVMIKDTEEKKEKLILPTVYVEDCLHGLKYDTLMGTLVAAILKVYLRGLAMVPDLPEETFDLDNCNYRELLEVKLVDTRLNARRCENLVTKPLGNNMAYIMQVVLDSDTDGAFSANVTKDMVKSILQEGETVNELFDHAIDNTIRKHEPFLTDINALVDNINSIEEMDYEKAGVCNYFKDGTWCPVNAKNTFNNLAEIMLVLTNITGYYGSTVLFYPDIQKRIRKMLDCDYYIIPSSVHDVIIVPDYSDSEAVLLKGMLLTANESEEDKKLVLSNSLFRYSDKDGLQICC